MSIDALIQLCESAKIETLPVDSLGRPGQADILRLDRIHPLMSGNKLFKCLDHLPLWHASGRSAWLTPGGPWSNHLHALASLAQFLGVASHALVRGYEHLPLTPTLEDCQSMGMQLHFLNKQEYRLRYDPQWQKDWSDRLDAYWIGEGGALPATSSPIPHPGMNLIASRLIEYDEVWLAVGSGTTARSLRELLPERVKIVGVNVVSDQGELASQWQAKYANDLMQVVRHEGMGRFGSFPESMRAILSHYDVHSLPLDPIYGSRLLWAWEQFGAEASNGKRCILVHGGGLQGRRGYGLDRPLVVQKTV